MNIVVAYCGANAQLQGSVLRLRKRSADGCADDFAPAPIDESYAFLRDEVEPRVACGCRACSGRCADGARLCSSELLVRGVLVEVAEPFLCELSRMCAPHRPAARAHRILDTASRRGWLLPDLSYIPPALLESGAASPRRHPLVLSVEIKPKSCILPRPALVRPEHAIKTRVSRFQMMQTTKLQAGKVLHMSRYDPLDLFSSQRELVEKALADLLDQPQNNLYLRAWRVPPPHARALRDPQGQVEASEDEATKDWTQADLADDGVGGNAHNTSYFTLSGDRKTERNRLLEEFFDVVGFSGEGQAGVGAGGRDSIGLDMRAGDAMAAGEKAFCRMVARVLQDCGVLSVVEHLQRLDAWDIENIAPMHDYVTKSERGADIDESRCRARAPGGEELPAVGRWRKCRDDFLVAQSAKDCSLILTLVLLPGSDENVSRPLPRRFRRVPVGVTGCVAGEWAGGAPDVGDLKGGQLLDGSTGGGCGPGGKGILLYSCGLMDLDMKDARKIPEYLQQDAKIVAAYLARNSSRMGQEREGGNMASR